MMEKSKSKVTNLDYYCSALYWLKLGGTPQPVLPWVAVKYFLIFLVCVAALVGILELRLAMLAKPGQIVSEPWKLENDAINQMNRAKIKSSYDDPLWRSDGIPMSGLKSDKSRIFVIGDSFVWGDGYLNANDIWWRQLERELQRRGYHQVEVVAVGRNGASTQDELHWLRDLKLLDNINPDLVVVGYATNDPDRVDAQGRHSIKRVGDSDAPPIPQWHELDQTLGFFAPNLTTQLKQQLTHKWESKLTDVYPYAKWELKLLEAPNIDAYRQVVEDLGEFVWSRNQPFFVVTLPGWPSKKFEVLYRPVEPIFAAAGIRFYNLLDDFLREYPSRGETLQWAINPANGHPGPVSTRFYARKVSDILEREYANFLGPRTAQPPLEPSINDWMPPTANVRRVGAEEWELSYPELGTIAPKLPIGEPYVMLAFAQPVAVKSVQVMGKALREAQLYLTSVDPANGVERKEYQALGSRSGDDAVWALAGVPGADHVNTLKLVAQIEPGVQDANPRMLRVRIEFDNNPVRP